ncbi:MAG: hypothetical protein RBS40_09010 [Rhodocyclaceae bacterium]|jgi:hypothetical protein|nr:hypothetical protein [Rhodocyclaceae bacterium]
MRYVQRDGAGRVVAVSLAQDAQHPEALEADSPELVAFGQELAGQGPLADSDLRLVRVLEDLIDLLIDKEVIRFTDLPAPAQDKLMTRRSLRHSLRGLKLLDDSDVL